SRTPVVPDRIRTRAAIGGALGPSAARWPLGRMVEGADERPCRPRARPSPAGGVRCRAAGGLVLKLDGEANLTFGEAGLATGLGVRRVVDSLGALRTHDVEEGLRCASEGPTNLQHAPRVTAGGQVDPFVGETDVNNLIRALRLEQLDEFVVALLPGQL